MKMDDLFDLDIKVVNTSANTGDVKPEVASLFWCTAGTCNKGCQPTQTFNSNCCMTTDCFKTLTQGCQIHITG